MILAPTLLLNAGSGAAIARPTFSRDFAGEKTLNNGTGPAITFTRASNATFFDANGTLQTAANDTPRFDHSGGSSLGLLIEEARTNSIRNSQAGGSTNGVIGSGGALPTNWGSTNASANGMATQIVATGTENGLAYIDLKLSGTPTASGSMQFDFESSTEIVAANSQTWTESAYCKLAAGSTSNATLLLRLLGRTSAGAAVSAQFTDQTFTPTSASLNSQRITVTRTMSSASVERALPSLRMDYTNGNAVDLTLRIAAPQLEQGAFATSYIPTTSAAVTRAADGVSVTPISSFYNTAEGTMFAEVQFPYASAAYATANRILNFGTNGSGNNQNEIRFNQSGGNQLMYLPQDGVGTAAQINSTTVAAGDTVKLAAGYAVDNFAFARAGSLVGTDTSGTVATTQTHMVIGSRRIANSTDTATAYYRKIAYWPKRLTNTLLEQLTT
jgi:hypothetical protein